MKDLKPILEKKFQEMCSMGTLYRVAVSGHQLWDLYLNSFPKKAVFRDPESNEYNCNCCNNFVKRYGNIVALSDNKIVSMWDIENCPLEYEDSLKAMATAIKGSHIEDIFVEHFLFLNMAQYEKSLKITQPSYRLGVDKNYKEYTKEEVDKFGVVELGKMYTFSHFSVELPARYVLKSNDSIESWMAAVREPRNVFKRGLETISQDTLSLVIDLINQDSIRDGRTFLPKVQGFYNLKKEYDTVNIAERENWIWSKSNKDNAFMRFRNEIIGTLCVDLNEGSDLNEAVMSFNKKVDPINYKVAKAPITDKMIADADKFMIDNGYGNSFERRLATLDDINVVNIKHINIGGVKMPNVSSPLNKLKATTASIHRRKEFNDIEKVTIEKFMAEILPNCTSIELYLENRHMNNMVTMHTAKYPDAKKIFNYPNHFGWTYEGGLAGKSMIAETVKERGGTVDAILRASIIWNESGDDHSDLDIWCRQADLNKIGYSMGFRKDQGNKFTKLGGQLDVDILNPGSKLGAENIYFKDEKLLLPGSYMFWVNQYSARNSQGFKFEIEADGEVYNYEYNKAVRGDVEIAEVTYKDGRFTVRHILPCSNEKATSKEIYGLKTNMFAKVNLVTLSPNRWADFGVGHLHYFFMLDNCVNPNKVRGFHNENLNNELLNHRKVLEVLGSKSLIESTTPQLSGVGFNATLREEVVLKIGGTFNRVVKVLI